jgi:hypothetical protein
MDPRVAYAAFIAETDRRMAELSRRHAGGMVCAAGCDACCLTERSALAIEADAVGRGVAALPERLRRSLAEAPPDDDRCPLLTRDGRCAVYAVRPFICRTHGVPLLIDTGDEVGVIFCERNFTDLTDDADFDRDDLLDTVSANRKLIEINDAFVAAGGGRPGRISLADCLTIDASNG